MATPATHLWRPSNARLLLLDGFLPVPRGACGGTPVPQVWPVKDPEDVLDYQLDLTPALVGDEGDSISTVDVSINPSASGDLTLVSAAADDPRVLVWLSGGRAGVTYRVTLRVSLASGRQIARDVLLPVVQLATPVDGNDLMAGGGQPITTPTGTLTAN